MDNTFVVLDSGGSQTWCPLTDEAETFATFDDAELRAHEEAKDNPGKVITIYEAVATVSSPVGEPSTSKITK